MFLTGNPSLFPQVQEKVSTGKDKLGGGEKSAGKKRALSSKTKSEKSDKAEKPEKSDKSEKDADVREAAICNFTGHWHS